MQARYMTEADVAALNGYLAKNGGQTVVLTHLCSGQMGSFAEPDTHTAALIQTFFAEQGRRVKFFEDGTRFSLM